MTSSKKVTVSNYAEITVQKFESSDAASDAYHYGEGLAVGSILVVESEEIVGVNMLYPFAVTLARGALSKFCVDQPTYDPTEILRLVRGIQGAVVEAQRRGYEIDPAFDEFKAAAVVPEETSKPSALADENNNTNVLAAAIKKHRTRAACDAAMANPVKAEACAEAIARTFARFASVDELTFLQACGIEPSTDVEQVTKDTPVIPECPESNSHFLGV